MKDIIDDGVKHSIAHDAELVTWDEHFVIGIELMDNQHKELVKLTNQLYYACLAGNDVIAQAFKEAMSQMVEYVRFHFSVEAELMKRVNFPEYNEHKAQHDLLVKQILTAASEFQSGKKIAANNFVRTLKDWIFGHIAVYDKSYAAFIVKQKAKGLLTDKQLQGNG